MAALREISVEWAERPIPVRSEVVERSEHLPSPANFAAVIGMPEDIHQDRFALVTVLTRAHEARPDDYADPQSLISMSDERLVAHATHLMHALEQETPTDETARDVLTTLQEILGEPI